MPSKAQIHANLQNSKKSTGPVTPEGKQRSAANALRHGFTGQVVIIGERQAGNYDQHCREYREEFSPKGKAESDLTRQLADLSWSINRIRACETTLFAVEPISDSSHDAGDPEVNSAIAVAATLEKNMKTLACSRSMSSVSSGPGNGPSRSSASFRKSAKTVRKARCTGPRCSNKPLRIKSLTGRRPKMGSFVQRPNWKPTCAIRSAGTSSVSSELVRSMMTIAAVRAAKRPQK
jgi:hypothetical protein